MQRETEQFPFEPVLDAERLKAKGTDARVNQRRSVDFSGATWITPGEDLCMWVK